MFRAFDPHNRTTLHDDAIQLGPFIVLPDQEHVAAILSFGGDAESAFGRVNIHCHAGISRSAAAMAMILAQAYPDEDVKDIIDWLIRIRPCAWPNARMIGCADELLGRSGRPNAAWNRTSAW